MQGNIKRDSEGYADEFQLQVRLRGCHQAVAPPDVVYMTVITHLTVLLNQLRHYHACLDIFKMKPSKESREFSELVGFISQARPPSALWPVV